MSKIEEVVFGLCLGIASLTTAFYVAKLLIQLKG